MPFYLAPYIGSGTQQDRCRPLGSEQPGWSAIDLRPDGGATPLGGGMNLCLLYLPLADPDSRLSQIADTASETLLPATISRMANLLGIARPAQQRLLRARLPRRVRRVPRLPRQARR